MGACLSSNRDDSITSIHKFTSAFVIPVKGDLRQYPAPVFVSEVLQIETPSCFVCNSDNLYYDQHITAMDLEDELDAGQIYFILPNTMLACRLSSSDMAALAVKASAALNSSTDRNTNISSSSSSNGQKRKNKAQISPLVWMETSKINVMVEEEGEDKNGRLGVSRSGSIRKLTRRYSSKKAGLGVRSFKLRLSTINESECSNELQIN